MNLQFIDTIFEGASGVTKIYQGSTQVWPPVNRIIGWTYIRDGNPWWVTEAQDRYVVLGNEHNDTFYAVSNDYTHAQTFTKNSYGLYDIDFNSILTLSCNESSPGSEDGNIADSKTSELIRAIGVDEQGTSHTSPIVLGTGTTDYSYWYSQVLFDEHIRMYIDGCPYIAAVSYSTGEVEMLNATLSHIGYLGLGAYTFRPIWLSDVNVYTTNNGQPITAYTYDFPGQAFDGDMGLLIKNPEIQPSRGLRSPIEGANLVSIRFTDSNLQYHFRGELGNNPNLTTVSFGSNTEEFEDDVFSGSTRLSCIICHATTAPTVSTNTFRGIANQGVLHYPSGSDYSTWSAKLPNGWTAVADL